MTDAERIERVEKRDVNPLGAAVIAWSFVGLLVAIAAFLWFTYSKRLLEWRELSSHGSAADFPEPRLIEQNHFQRQDSPHD